MRFLFCRISLVLLFLFAVTAASAKDAPHQAVANHFDLHRDNGTPLVEVQFSDTVTGLFAIDTGAYDSVMTADMAKRLGSKLDANLLFPIEILLGGSLVTPTVIHVPSLVIAKLHVTKIDFPVVPNNSLGTQNGRPIDGLIGGTLLSRFALLLDYPRRTMVWIYPGNLNDQAVKELGLDPTKALGLHQEAGALQTFNGQLNYKFNQYSVPVHLESGSRQRTENFLVDTGAPGSFVAADAAHRLNLVPQGTEPYGFVFQAPDVAYKATIPVFRLGPLSLVDVPVLYPSHRDAEVASILGENVLGKCVVLLDFGPHRFYLKPILPGMTADPLPAYDAHTVDWNRLRNSPDAADFPELLGEGLTADALDGVPQRVARLKAAMTGNVDDAAGYEQISLLLRGAKDFQGAETALSQAVALRQADAEAYPDDPARTAHWAEALILAGKNEKALDITQKNTVRWPKSSVAWLSQGQAQENQAASLLLGEWGKPVTEDQLLDSYANISQQPDKPDAARLQQISLLRKAARDSFGQAIALAPQDPAGYQGRARFWVLDCWLLGWMQDLNIKGQSPSLTAAAAGVLSDFQNEIRLDPDNITLLKRVVIVDTALPIFHDWKWVREHLKGSGQTMEMEKDSLMTAKIASAHLAALAQSSDKLLAASALEALGEAQASQDDPAAEATLRQAAALDPKRVDALAALVSRLVAENRLADLRDLLTTEAARYDTLPLRLLLSATLSALGHSDDAETQVRLALKLEPDNPVANKTLAGLLLARSGYDFAVLSEVSTCLSKSKDGYGAQATPQQKTCLQTMQAVWLALTSDPAGARQQLIDLSKEEPTSTQVREALSAMTIPPAAP